MVTQYPHKMTIVARQDNERDDSGEWEESEDPGTSDITCRAEPNSTNGFMQTVDGTSVKYDWTVYIPLPVDDIDPGTQAEIFDDNNVSLGKGSVKRFSRGQLNARAWI